MILYLMMDSKYAGISVILKVTKRTMVRQFFIGWIFNLPDRSSDQSRKPSIPTVHHFTGHRPKAVWLAYYWLYLLPHTTWRNLSMSDNHQRLSTSFKSIGVYRFRSDLRFAVIIIQFLLFMQIQTFIEDRY